MPLQAADLLAWHQYQYALDYLRGDGRTQAAKSKELQRLSRGGRVTLGLALRSGIEQMVAAESGNDEKLARAAELITLGPAEYVKKFNLL